MSIVGPKTRVLIVEDEPSLSAAVRQALLSYGFDVDVAPNLARMQQLIRARNNYAVILLDLSLPDGDGLEFCRKIRGDNPVGIIIISGRSEQVDRIIGLEAGADDYIAKPFELRELVARIRSLVRRLDQKPASPKTSKYYFDSWCFDSNLMQLNNPDHNIELSLTQQEAMLLESLLSAQGQALSRDELCAKIKGHSYRPNDRSLDNMISRVRKKLAAVPSQTSQIKSVRGTGYRFLGPVKRQPLATT